MQTLKYAKRTEFNTFWSSQLIRYITKDKQLPYNVTRISKDKTGTWYKVDLPAGVIALAFSGKEGHQVGYYHSAAVAADEIKGLTHAPRKTKASR